MIGNNKNNIINNINLNDLDSKNEKKSIFDLKLHSSGSFGVVLKNELTKEIYKITEFSESEHININNFVEMIHLNYFKSKYTNLYENDSITYLPIQNTSTTICYLYDFIKLYKIDNKLYSKIISILRIKNNDIIIVNKMKYYPNNLANFIFEKKITCKNILYIVECLILGLNVIHSDNLLHGDLKPHNIVLDNIGVKIIDFGGIKSLFNPNYECTCTSTYRSPEDYSHEFRNKNESTIWECSLKSDIWSLGLIFHEIIFGKNPILKIYNDIRDKNYKIDEISLENKINEYYKSINHIEIFNIDVEKKIMTKTNHEQTQLLKITKTLEKMLKLNPENRINLEEIYYELFFKKLPDFKKYSIKFDYKIDSENKTKFLKFRNFYYQFIYKVLSNNTELFLYPLLINLFDRYLITLFNSDDNISDQIKKCNLNSSSSLSSSLSSSSSSSLSSDTSEDNYQTDFYMCSGNIIYYDLENDLSNNKNLSYQMDHVCIITCTFYIMTKILILKEINKINLELLKFDEMFTEKFIKTLYPNIFLYFVSNLINISSKLNWDIARPKLYLYSNTDITKVEEIIEVFNDFNIEKIIEYSE